jgi:hypothetical protein
VPANPRLTALLRLFQRVSLNRPSWTYRSLTYEFINQSNERDFRKSVSTRTATDSEYCFTLVAQTNTHFYSPILRLQYQMSAQSIIDHVKARANVNMDMVEGISDLLSLEANQDVLDFPFVTLHSFDIYVKHSNNHLDGESIMYCPFVRDTTAWSNYSTTNQAWVTDSYAAEMNLSNEQSETKISSEVFYYETTDNVSQKQVYGDSCCDDGTLVAPIWQLSPIASQVPAINFDMLSLPDYKSMYETLLRTRTSVLGRISSNPLIVAMESNKTKETESSEYTLVRDYIEARSLDQIGFERPYTLLMNPVFDKLHDKQSDIVGMAAVVIPWDSYLRDILPKDLAGVYCIIQSDCLQKYTFFIDGPDVIFYGYGDFHEDGYSKFTVEYALGRALGIRGNETVEGNCNYTMYLHPSAVFRDRFMNDAAITFAVIVGLSFLVMAITYFIYDWTVMSKHSKIMDTAAQSNAIVSVSRTTQLHFGITL